MSSPPSLHYLQLALDHARQCIPTPTAFCVGCVIVTPAQIRDNENQPIILATGFSRELEGNTHAEANALTKARRLSKDDLVKLVSDQITLSSTLDSDSLPTIDELLRGADVYTTMEPCSVRLSGLAPCADGLIKARIKRCIIGVGEPADFVTCEGAQKLEKAGVEVVWMKDLEKECLEVARTGHEA